ncbi:phosphate signaling complex protein PhoU [Mesoplasma lactucae]|uniref:Phosphate transport system regulatory protein PhoU n=1 Tax=Mesoplasma lactucae ATCC 49193 TaxID=81460 RepID=A0A291IS46_9MOLU|nr:phosphate signaling complex protein PhoU [Mesoplasma lactucae]ATG97526.1 phosphate transport system regulatory protein PhoU [Mesoplasma lactucae ATCC 49193]ATZ20017.1 phosphate transport system regulator PhoU [Mesoplasma lactucae ATCC 49193]MCL8217032.1 hypothetical protein [Mesoplasma lactucae ATCC 49193]
MSVNKILDHDILVIKRDLQNMINATKKQYEETNEAVKNNDYQLAEKVISDDHKINDMQNNLTKTALWKIAKQNMVAGDLRLAIGSVLIAREIERIADYAKNICYFLVDYKPDVKYTKAIQSNFSIILKMLDMISTLIDHYDTDLNNKVDAFEKEVNDEFVKTRGEIISEIRHADSDEMAILLYTSLRQLKKLERAADHIISIQEILDFIRTGKFNESVPASFGDNTSLFDEGKDDDDDDETAN